MNEAQLKKYAELLVRSGGNVQKGQPVVISSDVTNACFARMVQEYAYDAGASEVVMEWRDDISSKAKYMRAADEIFDVYPQWCVDRFKFYDDRNAVYLHIISSDPDLLKEVSPDRIMRYTKANRKGTKAHSTLTMSNARRWSVLAVPSPEWAAKVFPDLDAEAGVAKLWEAIIKGARADGDNPIEDWAAHRENFNQHKSAMDKKQFKTLRFTNSLGTDITIGMPENHKWQGGGDIGQDGFPFFPNQPTEEIFTAPDRNKVNGKVVASMPLSYQSRLIEEFSITFKDGKAVEYQAKAGEEILKSIIEMDEGAAYLGEVALVANSSPISQMNILFYNTLFDENASSHFALGKAYPDCIENGINMNDDELAKVGLNDSILHVDFMFGTADMHVVGTLADGTEIVIMDQGELVNLE
ncbi:MAG: aminopeptidase [Defluviitaleaceae bacterium]|nr:aminopeptidase [Defluviitaleaceae bacterium]